MIKEIIKDLKDIHYIPTQEELDNIEKILNKNFNYTSAVVTNVSNFQR